MVSIGSHRTPAPRPAWTRASPQVQAGPLKHVVYAPFSHAEAKGAKVLGTSWEKWSKYDVRRHGDSARPLAFINVRTIVYVVAHCGAGSTTIEDNARAPGPNKLTAAGLAARIKADGLSVHHLVMRLYACEGAADGTNNSPSFARQLLDEMRQIGYSQLALYAYTQTVSSLNANTGHKFALTHDGSQVLGRAKQFRTQV